MVITVVLVGVGLVIELCAAIAAPLGYQDETGFHVDSEGTGSGEPGGR